MQSDLTLIALQTLILTDLQKEGTIAERETAIDTFSTTDAKIMVDNVLKIRGFHFPTGKRIDRTKLVFRSFISCKGLRIKKAGAEITITAHSVIVKALDRRHRFVAPIGAHPATDALCGINLPNNCLAADFLFGGEQTDGTEEPGGKTIPATRFQ